jgi:hypothetical protein
MQPLSSHEHLNWLKLMSERLFLLERWRYWQPGKPSHQERIQPFVHYWSCVDLTVNGHHN